MLHPLLAIGSASCLPKVRHWVGARGAQVPWRRGAGHRARDGAALARGELQPGRARVGVRPVPHRRPRGGGGAGLHRLQGVQVRGRPRPVHRGHEHAGRRNPQDRRRNAPAARRPGSTPRSGTAWVRHATFAHRARYNTKTSLSRSLFLCHGHQEKVIVLRTTI